MTLIIFLELKHTHSVFFGRDYFVLSASSLWLGDVFMFYSITHCHSKFCIEMNDANPFICCYDVSAVALLKFAFLCNISSGIFGNVLSVRISFLRVMFASDLTWCLS